MLKDKLSKPIRLITVDDHEILRGGIRFLMQAFDELELVGEARNGQEAIHLCEQLQPDVVLMDLVMSRMNGVDATKTIKEKYPKIQVVVLTGFPDTKLIKKAMQAGAISYLLKGVSIDEFVDTLRAAALGRSILPAEAIRTLLQESDFSVEPIEQLSKRQREILILIAKGMTNRAIAEYLGLSPSTVRHHITEIFNKLGLKNRVEATNLAIKLLLS